MSHSLLMLMRCARIAILYFTSEMRYKIIMVGLCVGLISCCCASRSLRLAPRVLGPRAKEKAN